MMKGNNEVIKHGYSIMAKSSTAICSIVRDCNKSLIRNVPLVEELRSKFKNSTVIVFENDSTDGTKKTLVDWTSKVPDVIVQSQDLRQKTIPKLDNDGFNKYFSMHRISRMANHRNQYLEILDNLKTTFDYLIVIDLDIEKFTLDGIAHSFGLSDQWDVVTAYGYSLSPFLRKRYHDTYALVELGKEKTAQSEGIIFENRMIWSFLKPGLPLIPVYSAFGGLAIYKYELVRGKRYGVMMNDDKRVQVKCEHFSFHHQVHGDGYKRIFINPNMPVLYQKIDVALIRKVVSDKISRNRQINL